MTDGLPATLAELVAEMEARGFTVSTDDASAAFGNRFLELSHPTRRTGSRVQLIRDRGLWSAEVEVVDEFFDAYDVVQALDDAPYSTRALSHEERRRLTVDAIDRLPTDEAGLRSVHQRLMAYRKEYTRRLGVEVD